MLQIVAMSGHAKDRRLDAVKLMQLGANDFFAKPFAENDESLDWSRRPLIRMHRRMRSATS